MSLSRKEQPSQQTAGLLSLTLTNSPSNNKKSKSDDWKWFRCLFHELTNKTKLRTPPREHCAPHLQPWETLHVPWNSTGRTTEQSWGHSHQRLQMFRGRCRCVCPATHTYTHRDTCVPEAEGEAAETQLWGPLGPRPCPLTLILAWPCTWVFFAA